MVVRNREGEDLAVHLVLALYSTEELDDSPYRKGHAVSALAVGNFKRLVTALNLAGQEWEVHVMRGYE
jgi:hypothetical protein